MKIGLLGWGSLIWAPGTLRSVNGIWKPDGPLLPIEFLRVSGPANERRLTLIITDLPGTRSVRTLWTVSSLDRLDRATADLAGREQLKGAQPRVGFVKKGPEALALRSHMQAVAGDLQTDLLTRIDAWLAQPDRELDAVIWTDLGRNAAVPPPIVDVDSAIAFLRGLIGTEAEKAREYVERAPAQVRTVGRERIETDLGWLPKPIASPIQSADDPRFKEWSECRTTVGRFDTILEDLRKYGFSIITGLLAASSFLSFFGVVTTSGVPAPAVEVRVAVFAAIMTLVATLFFVDTYYEVLLSAAVERALDIEVATEPPIRLSKYLSYNALRTGVVDWTKRMYYLLYWIAAGLAGVMLTRPLTGTEAPVPAGTGGTATSGAVPDRTIAATAAIVLAAYGLALFTLMYFYRRHADDETGLNRSKLGREWAEGEGKRAVPV